MPRAGVEESGDRSDSRAAVAENRRAPLRTETWSTCLSIPIRGDRSRTVWIPPCEQRSRSCKSSSELRRGEAKGRRLCARRAAKEARRRAERQIE